MRDGLDKLASDLPALKRKMKNKVTSDELETLKSEILGTVEDIAAAANDDPDVTMGGIFVYCPFHTTSSHF